MARKSRQPVEEAPNEELAPPTEVEESDAAPATPEAPPIPGRHWYAVHTYSGHEKKVKTHLEARITSMGMADRIFNVVVPTEDEIEVKNGQRRVVARKVYPGYVLVDMVLDEFTWYVVKNTPGVTGFVGGNGVDAPPLPEHELSYILRSRAKGEEPKPKARITYQVGQSVKVIDGPFQEFIGTVSEILPERNKVTVLVSFFGRETPVQLDFFQVEKM